MLLYFTEHNNEKLYKIGIIDSETFKLNSSKPNTRIRYALSACIQLFPYHFEVIIEWGKTFCDIDPNYIEVLREKSLKSMQLYKIVCEDNFSFYQKHHITLQNQVLFSLTPERKEEIKKHMGSFVRTLHDHGLKDYWSARDCLNDDPDASAHRFQEEICPIMISLIEKKFNKILTTSSKGAQPGSYGELIEKRMVNDGITTALNHKLLWHC